MYSINCLTKWYKKWETNGWKTVNGKAVENKEIIQSTLELLERLRTRGCDISFRYVKGHSGDPGNEEADRLAN